MMAAHHAVGTVSRRGSGATLLGGLLLVCMTAVAFAFWAATGSGTGTARAASLSAPTITELSLRDADVTVSFNAAVPDAGTLTGYYVSRFAGSTRADACGTTPGSPSTYLLSGDTTCVDSAVPAGTYTYVVTAVQRSWTASSAASAPLQVTGDSTAPTQAITTTSTSAHQSGTTVYVRTGAAGSLTFTSTVSDAESGPASATFPAANVLWWAVNGETVTTGTGTNPRAFTSQPLTWSAGAATPLAYAITAADQVGNTTVTTLNIVSDNTAPTGGALVVGGASATPSGATFFSTTGTFSQSSKLDFSDAGSGMKDTTITRRSAEFAAGGCGPFGSPTTVESVNETGAANGCYQYVLSGTDRVGNLSTITVTALVDRVAPTQAIAAKSLVNASQTANTVYYRPGVAGSFNLEAAVTDPVSGAASAAFPAVGTAGWTHAAETVASGTSSASTTTYTSSPFAWTANPSAPSSYSVTASDRAGNTVSTALSLVADAAAPTGGSLTVNGTVASSSGTTSFGSSSYLGNLTGFSDAGSGVGIVGVTRAQGSLVGASCSVFGIELPVSITNGVFAEADLAGGCYRYTVTATDKVGNTSTATTTVRVDVMAPTQVITASGSQAAINNGTIYFLNTSGSSNNTFTLSAELTDFESGPKHTVFPGLSASGWTSRSAETVTTPTSTAGSSATFTSANYGWTSSSSSITIPSDITVTSSDNAGRTVSTTLSFSRDTTAPTGGSVEVNGVTSASGGSTAYARAAFTGAVTAFSDAGAGVASTTLTRATASHASGTCGTFGTATTITTISESSVAATCFRYTLSATDRVGLASTTSLTVVGDTVAPTLSLSESGANSRLSSGVLSYAGGSAGSMVLSASVSDSGSGPVSAGFPAIGTAGWTHDAETVTSGSGTNPVVYASSSFTWVASPSNPSTYTVTATDRAGNTAAASITFTADTAGPTGGSLEVDGTAGTSAGALDVITSERDWSGTVTQFSADAGSGLASSALTREVSTNGACTVWNAATSITSISEDGEDATGDRCYRYTLTGIDNVGNASVSRVTVSYRDTSAPSQVLSLSSASNAALSGSTVYFRSNTSGSFRLVSTVTDSASGPAQVAFPSLSGTSRWSGGSNTSTTGTGAWPTITYTSSSYSWSSNNPGTPPSRTVTASDAAGRTQASNVTFAVDNSAPTGGSLVIKGTTSSSGGSTGAAPAAFTGTVTGFTDAGAGIESNVITRSTATLTGTTCGTFGTAAAVASINESNATGLCVRYVLTGTDRLGLTASTSITVLVDAVDPTMTLTESGANSELANGTVFYRAGQPGSLTLSAVVSDSGSGPGSASFPAIATAGWTHDAETVTSGTGTNPKTFTSSAFAWTAGATVPGTYTVSGADLAGNAVTADLTFVGDGAGPTGGALTVAGVAGEGSGATAYSRTGTFSGTFTAYGADSLSGLAVSTMVRETAPLAGAVCGTYGSSVTLTGTTITASSLAANCYRYTLTGTDKVGNTSSLSVIVRVDTVGPTQLLSTSSVFAHISGTTLFYNGAAASGRSLTLASEVTDGGAGPSSVSFGALGGTTSGWTFTSGVDSSSEQCATPSLACGLFSSNVFSWEQNTTSSPTAAVTASDLAGNTSAQTLTFTNDSAAPTGGSLTVNGCTNTSCLGSGIGSSTAFSISRTDYADASSGIETNVLTVERASWLVAFCGSYGSPTTIAGNSYTSTSSGCYRFTLTGTDNVGNTATRVVVVRKN